MVHESKDNEKVLYTCSRKWKIPQRMHFSSILGWCQLQSPCSQKFCLTLFSNSKQNRKGHDTISGTFFRRYRFYGLLCHERLYIVVVRSFLCAVGRLWSAQEWRRGFHLQVAEETHRCVSQVSSISLPSHERMLWFSSKQSDIFTRKTPLIFQPFDFIGSRGVQICVFLMFLYDFHACTYMA